MATTTTTTTKQPIAIIAGVGSGTGAALARRFAKSYPVVLLARNPSNFESLAAEINKSGGTAVGISTDLSSEESVANAFAKITESDVYGGAPVAAAVFNASTRPKRKPFLESTAEEFGRGYDVSVYVYDVHLPFAIIGLFLFFSLSPTLIIGIVTNPLTRPSSPAFPGKEPSSSPNTPSPSSSPTSNLPVLLPAAAAAAPPPPAHQP